MTLHTMVATNASTSVKNLAYSVPKEFAFYASKDFIQRMSKGLVKQFVEMGQLSEWKNVTIKTLTRGMVALPVNWNVMKIVNFVKKESAPNVSIIGIQKTIDASLNAETMLSSIRTSSAKMGTWFNMTVVLTAGLIAMNSVSNVSRTNAKVANGVIVYMKTNVELFVAMVSKWAMNNATTKTIYRKMVVLIVVTTAIGFAQIAQMECVLNVNSDILSFKMSANQFAAMEFISLNSRNAMMATVLFKMVAAVSAKLN